MNDRIKDLLEANNRYQDEGRAARAALGNIAELPISDAWRDVASDHGALPLLDLLLKVKTYAAAAQAGHIDARGVSIDEFSEKLVGQL